MKLTKTAPSCLPWPHACMDGGHPALAALAPPHHADVAYTVRQHLRADHGAAGLRHAAKLCLAALLGAPHQACCRCQLLWWGLALHKWRKGAQSDLFCCPQSSFKLKLFTVWDTRTQTGVTHPLPFPALHVPAANPVTSRRACESEAPLFTQPHHRCAHGGQASILPVCAAVPPLPAAA